MGYPNVYGEHEHARALEKLLGDMEAGRARPPVQSKGEEMEPGSAEGGVIRCSSAVGSCDLTLRVGACEMIAAPGAGG